MNWMAPKNTRKQQNSGSSPVFGKVSVKDVNAKEKCPKVSGKDHTGKV